MNGVVPRYCSLSSRSTVRREEKHLGILRHTVKAHRYIQ